LNDIGGITPPEYFSVFMRVHGALSEAVRKRVEDTTDRPIACLLSGGLDSSLIAALVSKYYNKQLETYSIGMPGGEDLKYARIVAEHIGSKHTEIILTEDEFFGAIPEVIEAIESYDTTSVRASVGNYLVSKYISQNSKAKVIFNGDGSDELTGGYLYFHSAPNALEFDKEVKRLLNDIYLFDVLRSDKSISSHGLEPRTPFLDRMWVQTYLSVPLKFRYNPGKMEKWLLRRSIEAIDPELLPREVLWRTKEAFSDGVSSHSKSWYEIITEKVSTIFTGVVGENNYTHLPPQTLEQQYYRTIFERLYPNCSNVVPYFWMPRFVNATDASARTLNIYKKLI
jgi:asparagine synthase (glutamine-hydrolysing)